MNTRSEEFEPQEDEEAQEREVAPAQARKVTESFTQMRAYQQELKRAPENATDSFYGSRKKFIENCRTVYPIEVVDASQAGTEIVKGRQELEALDQIPNLTAELAKTANNIRLEQVNDPIKLIREIDKIIGPSSVVVRQYLEQFPGEDFEAESQLDRFFREVYRLELLRDQLERSLSIEQKEALASGKEETERVEGGTEPVAGESIEEFRARIEQEVEANWERLLKEQLRVSLDEWFRQGLPGDPDWTMFGSDTGKWERLHNGMRELKQDWREDERMISEKMFEYEARLNELLRTL